MNLCARFLVHTLSAFAAILEIASAQAYTEEPIPMVNQSLRSAELYRGKRNSIHLLGLADSLTSKDNISDSYVRKLFLLKWNNGSFSPEIRNLDTSKIFYSVWEGSSQVSYATSLAVDSLDEPVVAWSEAPFGTSDIVYPRLFRKPALNYAAMDKGIFRRFFHFEPGINPSLALDRKDIGHLVWESPQPFRPNWPPYSSTGDTNYYFSKSVIYYARIVANAIINPMKSLGKGYRPQIHIDKTGLAHVFWLRADSSNSTSYQLMYTKGIDGVFDSAQVIVDGVSANRPFSQVYETPSFDSFIDDSGSVYAGWTETEGYSSSKLLFVTYAPRYTATIDTLGHQQIRSTPVIFFVERSGVKHVLWSTNDNASTGTMHYSRGSSTLRLFENQRTFRSPSGYWSDPHLVVDSRDTVSAVFSDYPAAIGFLRNLWNGPDSVIKVSPGSSVSIGTRDQWGNMNNSKTVIVDELDQIWIVASENVPSLVRLDRSLTRIAKNTDEIPHRYALSQNYPNPFNPRTEIKFQLSEASVVTLKIYDVLGREVATFFDEGKAPGVYSVSWDASRMSSGVYLYRLQARPTGNSKGTGFVEIRKMILTK